VPVPMSQTVSDAQRKLCRTGYIIGVIGDGIQIVFSNLFRFILPFCFYQQHPTISNPDILMLPMDYSTGVLNTMSSSFFPVLRGELGPYLVDKMKLIENIIVHRRLTGHVDLVLRPRHCGKSTMLQMLK
jgi:hypothetical protein